MCWHAGKLQARRGPRARAARCPKVRFARACHTAAHRPAFTRHGVPYGVRTRSKGGGVSESYHAALAVSAGGARQQVNRGVAVPSKAAVVQESAALVMSV